MKAKSLKLILERQLGYQAKNIPAVKQLRLWAKTALTGYCCEAHLCIRIVDEQESSQLNQSYRQKQGPTNILSFCYEKTPLYGDLAICAPVLEKESQHLNYPLTDYWAYLVIHGMLHLVGFDHQNDQQATKMEELESQLLKQLDYIDPHKE